MSSKKVIELFYDVVSPYSWLGFEVCLPTAVNRFTLHRSRSLHTQLCFQIMCRYRNVWNIDLKLRPAFLGGVMQGSGESQKLFQVFAAPRSSSCGLSLWFNVFTTGNKPPGLVPNKYLYMTKDMSRLAEYCDVPLRPPLDPFEAMFQKGTAPVVQKSLLL